MLSLTLDNKHFLRIAAGAVAFGLGVLLSLHTWLMRLLTCTALWQTYPRWSRLIHLPLVLKFWGGKLLFQYLFSFYLKGEKWILEYLTEVETAIVEPRLPVTDSP